MLHLLRKDRIEKKDNYRIVKSSPFDPTIAPNNIAVYNGDVSLDNTRWRDTAGSNQITFTNLPTYNATGLNGHGTILFNGTSQYGQSGSITKNQPYTIYIVFRVQTFLVTMRIFDGLSFGTMLATELSINDLSLYAGASLNNGSFPILNWNILTVVFNGSNSIIRCNLNTPVNGDLGTANSDGIMLASRGGLPGSFSNSEFAYIILRNGEDPIYIQNNFINYLKNRFAI